MPATTHKYKINQLQSDNTLLTLHPETDAIITLYNPENITFPTAKTINTQPADWAENYNKLYYIVTETSTGSGQWQISTKNTSQTFDTNKRYVKCYLTLAGQNITEVDTALDALTVTINDALNDIATNSGVQAIKVGNTNKKGTVELVGTGITTLSTPSSGANAGKIVINSELAGDEQKIVSFANNTLTFPGKLTIDSSGNLGTSGTDVQVTFGTAAFKDYTTDTTLEASGETGKLPTAATIKTYVDNKITQGVEFLGVVGSEEDLALRDSRAGLGDWVRVDADFYVHTEYTGIAPSYELTTSKPADWDTLYNDYYIKSGSNYERISAQSAPTWAANRYYKDINAEKAYVGDIIICVAPKDSNAHAHWDVLHTAVEADTNTTYQALVGAAGTNYAGSILLQKKELNESGYTNQDTIKFVNGSNIAITPNTTNKTIKIDATNTWRPVYLNNVVYKSDTDTDTDTDILHFRDSSTIKITNGTTGAGMPYVEFGLNLTAPQSGSNFIKINQDGNLSLDTNTYLTQNQGIKIYSGKKADGTTDIVTATASGTAPILGDSGIVVNEDSTKGTVGVATYSAIMVNKKGIAIAGGNIVEVGTAINGTPSANLAIGGIYYQLIAD